MLSGAQDELTQPSHHLVLVATSDDENWLMNLGDIVLIIKKEIILKAVTS